MVIFKKIGLGLVSLIASSWVCASPYMIVQCNMNPVASPTASYSDPKSGKMVFAESCGIALMQVPSEYVLISSTGAGVSTAAFVNYLFGPHPTRNKA